MRAALVSLGLMCAACGDIDVRVAETPPPEPEAPPLPPACDDQPAGEDSVVKLIVALDASGSMQFTDQSGRRLAALRDLLSALSASENLLVATFGFGSTVNVDPPIAPGSPLFLPVGAWVEPAFLGLADVQSDMQNLLESIRLHVAADMLATDPGELSRTRYVITLLTDGTVSPVCCSAQDETDVPVDPYGCALETFEVPVAGAVYCEAQQEQGLCDDQDSVDRFKNLNPGFVPGPDYGGGQRVALADLQVGGDYNRALHLPAIVNDIRSQAAELGVGDLDVNVGLLFDPTLSDAVREVFQLNQCRSQFLAQSLAGDDAFVQFLSTESVDFSIFDVAPL